MRTKFLLISFMVCSFWCFTLNAFSQGGTLPLNGSVNGTFAVNTADTWQITTNGDGLLQFTITDNDPTNYMVAGLYDHDGTTAIGNATVASPGHPGTVNTDGLAAGTYYIKIFPYSPNQSAAYTLADTLIDAPVPNDMEPNNNRATALKLALNDSTTGHWGYYYNHYRDTTDWYKITTTSDGLLRVTLTDHATNNYVNFIVYDNDGVTPVFNGTTATVTTPGVATIDGLAAGTYYIEIYPYTAGQFAPYTLSDSLFTYQYAEDKAAEPNNLPYLAKTIPANRTINGHFGFYYNNRRDTTDWWKINYTGTSGDLNLSINLLRHLSNGELDYAYFYVYKDTSAVPVYQTTLNSTSNVVNLTSLSQGYYYIKITVYNPNQFNAYSITNSFTQVNVAAISLLKSASHNACGTDSLIYGLSASHSPYTVRLYRNGALYDSLTTVSDSAVFGGLNDGNYYATVYGDGATDAAFGQSAGTTQFLPPTPAGLTSSKISTTSAQLNWSAIGCVKNYQLQYMITGGSTWTTINSNSNNSYNLMGLIMDTTYSWRVASIDTVNSVALESVYSAAMQFTTLADTAQIAFVAANTVNDCSNTSKLQYQISHSEPPYSVQLYRFGVAYGTPMIVNDNNPFTISNLPAGSYYATVFGDNVSGALGTSSTSNILPPTPTGLNATNVTSNSATLNWSMISCTNYDTLEYRATDTATWKTLTTTDNTGIYNLANLASNVTYLFRVASVVSGNGENLSSAYSSTFTFKTLSDLPVTLVNFSASAHNNLVTLNWSTATELNNKGFEIFRSVDGTSFTSIGFVAGAGNSDLLLNYQFTDKPGLSGNVYYRFKQIDLDGNFVWSNIVSATLNSQRLITFMPNPAKSFITISSPVIVKQIRLFAITGQLIKMWNSVSPNAQLDLGAIARGSYVIQFINDQSVQTRKLLKE